MYAFALPRECRSSEICWNKQKNLKKNIPDIIDCNLKKDQQILIIFGINIFGTTGYKISLLVSISPSVCFCTTWRKTFIDTAVNEWRKRLLDCVRIVGKHFKQFYCRQLENGQLDEMSAMENGNKMCFYALCYLSNHIAFDKKWYFPGSVSPGSAETNAEWGEKLNGQLLASCVRNIRTKNYQNLIIGFQVTVTNVGHVFLRHSVYINIQCHNFW